MKNSTFITFSALSAALITICSWISIPVGAVPVTLQVFAVFLVAFIFGSKVALYSTLTWIVLGLVGLPVFSGISGGLSVLAGPTAGFIWAFLPAAFLAGKAGEAFNRLAFFVAIVSLFILVYPLGTWQLMRFTGLELKPALSVAVYPFIVFDLAKICLAYAVSLALKRSGLTKFA